MWVGWWVSVTTVLAIDQRLARTTAVVVDGAGTLLARSERAVDLHALPGGRVEQEPREVLASVVDAGRAAVADAGVPIDVVALAPEGESVLAWDMHTGRPLSNLIVQPGQRADEVRAGPEGEDVIGERARRLPTADRPALKLAWLRRHVTSAGVATTSDSWLLHQLTGEFVTEASTASRSLLVDVDTGRWDHDLVGLFGLAGQPMPAIVSSDRIVGSTIAFGGTTLLGGVINSGTAMMLGEGCVDPAEAVCTFRAGATLSVNAGRAAPRSSAGLTSSVAWRIRNETTYCIGGKVDTAASAVHWMKQLGFIASTADLDRVAAPDAGGVLAVPALAGLGPPWQRPDAKTCISGMTRFTTRGHLVVAILQGVAAQVAALGSVAAVDLERPLTRLRVDGRLTTCRTLMQSLADLMQIEVEVHSSVSAAALGAAAVARTATDPALDLRAAITPSRPSAVFTPRWSSDQADDFRSRWAEAAEAA